MNQKELAEHLRNWRPGPRGVAPPRPVAATAWRCEGRWQADEQLDIWQCIDNTELDERRKRGDLDDDE